MTRNRRARWWAALAAGLATFAVPATTATAHTETLAGSNPEAGSVVRTLDAVELRFVDTIQTDSAAFTLRSGDGTDVGLPAATFGQNNSVATIRLTDPPPEGRYRIGYQVIFEDGDPAAGIVEFELSADGITRAPAWPGGDLSPTVPKQRFAAGPIIPWLVGGSAAALLALTVVMVRARRRQHISHTDT